MANVEMTWIWTGSVTAKGGEGAFKPNRQTNLVIALRSLSILFFNFINTTPYH